MIRVGARLDCGAMFHPTHVPAQHTFFEDVQALVTGTLFVALGVNMYAHAGLLTELSAAVAAFVKDLDQHGHGKRVAVVTFSEFGRRLKENASQGTDHGAAAPMFVAGGKVKSGLLGKHPSMTDLDEGDLKFTTDFRAVYAGVLEHWLGVDSQPVLGQKFEPVKVTA